MRISLELSSISFSRQVKMIKERLEEELGKAHKVMVGSTEQFQGQEKEAMVLTTARSSLTCMKEGTGGTTIFLLGDRSGRFKPPVDLRMTVLAAAGPLL